jgi:hypothetical protein
VPCRHRSPSRAAVVHTAGPLHGHVAPSEGQCRAVTARRVCERARLPGRRRDAEGGRAVHRLARDGRGKLGQRKKRVGGHGGGRSEHANDAALDQVASATASALGAIKQQAMSSAATLVGTVRAEPWPSLLS